MTAHLGSHGLAWAKKKFKKEISQNILYDYISLLLKGLDSLDVWEELSRSEGRKSIYGN